MEEIFAIIGFVFSILGLILFFKIWTMTNQISAIKKELTKSDFRTEKAIAYGKGNVEEVLFDSMFDELTELCASSSAKHMYDEVIDKHKVAYQRAGIEFPTKFEDMNYEKMLNIMNIYWESTLPKSE